MAGFEPRLQSFNFGAIVLSMSLGNYVYDCFYNRVQKRRHEKKPFFFYISAFWIPPGIPYRCRMMKSIHRPLGGDRFVEARDMAA